MASQSIIPQSILPHLKRFGFSGAIALAVVVIMLAGLNPVSLVTGEYSAPPPPTVLDGAPAESAPVDDLFAYANLVSSDQDIYWRRAFRQASVPYASPKFIVVNSNHEFGCGVAGAELGTFYCRQERTIYSDLSAYEALAKQYGLPAHWAQAAAIAFAFGNHVQYLVDHFVHAGVESSMPKVPGGTTPELVLAGQQLGMQAWCYAGIWVKTAGLPNLLQDAQYVRAIDAAMAVGAAQDRALGQGIYKALPPPTIADRDRWFAKGYEVPASGTCKMSRITEAG